MSSATLKIRSATSVSCMRSWLTQVSSLQAYGSGTCDAGTIHGPIGAPVSKFLWPNQSMFQRGQSGRRDRSRSETSFITV